MRDNSKTKSDADREQTRFRRSAFKKKLPPGRSNEYRASMHWGVACITAHAMTMGSLTDDQIRYSPDDVDEANFGQYLKILAPTSYIMSNPPALLLRGQTLTPYFARQPSAIPTPATTVSPVPNLSISQSCCCV